MKQNKQQKSWKWLFSSKKRMALTAVVALLVLGQLAFDGYILFRVWLVPPDTRITERIIESVERFSSPGVVDPVSKKVYMPEANVVLPYYPAGISGIRYGYSAAIDNGGASLFITSTNAINRAADGVQNAGLNRYAMESLRNDGATLEHIFDEVPKLQACSRGYEVVFGGDGRADLGDAELVERRTLADGRPITVYREKGCVYQPESMTNYVKQLQSY